VDALAREDGMSGDRLGWLMIGASYLAGSVPFGLLLARFVAGVDVRESGSGNIGATNVGRTAGRSLGVLTLLLDAGKGGISVAVTALVLGAPHDGDWAAAAGLAAILGHVFPIWLGFRGGKGVATALGVFVVLSPWMALLSTVAFAATFGATRIASLGSMTAAAVMTAGCAVFHGIESPVTRVAAVVFLVILLRHQENIRRMFRGQESRLGATRSGSRSSRPPDG
jgi:glycerol-3-phosphate acyltransferase PlsY